MIRAYLTVFLTSVCIFFLAGRLNYWQGWLFSATYVVFLVIVSVTFADKKDLIQERVKPGPGTKWWDKIFFALYIPLAISIIIVAALDAGRFRWSGNLSIPLYIISYTILFLSYFAFLWAMYVNKFFSSRVRIQTDRGHYVIQNGPYRFVRHPGYAAAVLLLPCFSLALGSLWALIPAGLIEILLIIRTYLEDEMLKKELPGYADYAQRVRFRLIPHIW